MKTMKKVELVLKYSAPISNDTISRTYASLCIVHSLLSAVAILSMFEYSWLGLFYIDS